MIRILLVDDQDLLCEILQTSLETEPDLEIVGRAKNGEIALEKIDRLRPDIVLIDINMPVMDGLTATEKIVRDFPETKVIILSGSEEASCRTEAINAGAKSYIPKTAKARDITERIRQVYRDSNIASPELELTETIMQLNHAKREIQGYIQQLQQKISQFEHKEAQIKQNFGKLENEQGELSEELVSFKLKVESTLGDLRTIVQESKQRSREMNRIQTLVEGQLSYIHNINNRIKYFRKYLIVLSAITVVALILAIIGLFA